MSFIIPILAIPLFLWVIYSWIRWNEIGRYRRETSPFRQSRLVGVLMGLDAGSVDELMELYKKEFGINAARYARKTYQKWKVGKVQPATQTYERFLVHLPKVMDYDLKCDVLRHFLEEYTPKDNHEITVTADDWEEKLTPLVKQITEKAYTAQLPPEVERQLNWLSDGDMVAAGGILRASQAEESRIIVSMLSDEFANIETLLKQENLKSRVTHVLRFPYGTITLNIKRK